MVALSVGDLVKTSSDRVYTVRHVGPRGALSLEPVRRRPGRHATTARTARLIRSAELERVFALVARARRYMLTLEDPASAATMLTQAAAWLERADTRGADNPPELTWAFVCVRMNCQQLKMLEATT